MHVCYLVHAGIAWLVLSEKAGDDGPCFGDIRLVFDDGIDGCIFFHSQREAPANHSAVFHQNQGFFVDCPARAGYQHLVFLVLKLVHGFFDPLVVQCGAFGIF